MTACPTREDLTDFALGAIDEEMALGILKHLESCPSCEKLLSEVEGVSDRLIELVSQPAPFDRYTQEPSCRDALARIMELGTAEPEQTDPADGGTVEEEKEEVNLGQLGDYKLQEELSHGGMGTVYRATHVRLAREVALKVLPKGRMADHRAVARFEREMAAVGRLDHPNIVRATDASEVDGVQYLAMELIEGFDLTELVDFLGPLNVPDSCEVVRQAAIGLQYSYENGLVHRDIKPSNIMVTTDGVAKILDLGLARFQLDTPSNVELTTAGQPMGTADYMAPEQVADTHSVDIRADIYSLGCTFYKIIAGQPPFGGVQYSSSFDKMMAHRKTAPPSVQEFRPDLSKKVMGVLERMLAKDPDERYQTPIELAESIYPLCVGADLVKMIDDAWTAAEASPAPKDPTEATDEHDSQGSSAAPTPRRRPRMPANSDTGSHSKSRSQFSSIYMPPPPPKLNWKLWVGVMAVIALIPTVLSVGTIYYLIRPDQQEEGGIIGLQSSDCWDGPLEPRPAVQRPQPADVQIASLSIWNSSGGPLNQNALVARPGALKGVDTWTLETIGHRSPISAVAVDPAALQLATGSGEGTIRIWNLADGQLDRALLADNPAGGIRSLAWSPGGRYLASAYASGRLLIWDIQAGTIVQEFPARSLDPNSVAWSPDGTILAFVDADQADLGRDNIRLWNASTGKMQSTLSGHEGRVTVVVFSPDGKWLAAGGSDLKIRIWGVQNARQISEIRTQQFHRETVYALAWSPCATMLASSCLTQLGSHGVAIWDARSGYRLGAIDSHPCGDISLAWLPDGKTIVGTGGYFDRMLRFWTLPEVSIHRQFDGAGGIMATTPDGSQFVVVASDGTVRKGDGSGPVSKITSLTIHAGLSGSVAFSPDGGTVACGYDDGSVRFHETATGSLQQQFDIEGQVQDLTWHPDGSALAVTAETWNEALQRTARHINVLDMISGDPAVELDWSGNPRTDVLAWSPDGKTIATLGDRLLRLWDAESGRFLRDFSSGGSAIVWAPESNAIATGSDKNVKIRDASSGSELFKFADSTQRRRVMSWSKDSGMLVSTGGDDSAAEILLWNPESEEPVHRLSGDNHSSPVCVLGWQDGGKMLVSGSATEVCCWNTESGRMSRTVPVGVTVFSPDAQLAAEGGPSTLRLHRLDDGTLSRTILSLSESKSAILSPAGHWQGSQLRNKFISVVQTEQGQQTFLSVGEFMKKYGWKNEP